MILVTGGTGLLGSHVLLKLALRNEKVRALKRPHSSMNSVRFLFRHHPERFQSIEWHPGDITNPYDLTEALQGAEKVYHCAAMISFDPKNADEMMRINVQGTANVVNACLEQGIQKLCYASSVAAISRTDESQIITEEMPWKNSTENSNYAISKYLAEQEVWRGIAEGLNAVIINPGIIIGTGNWQSGSGRLFTTIRNGLKFYTEGITGFVAAEDAAECMVQLMESDIHSERFIVVAENKSYRDVLFAIADGLGAKRPSIKAGKTLAGIAWRAERIRSILLRKQPFITRETAASGIKKVRFSNEKIRHILGIEFQKIDTVIAGAARDFMLQPVQPTLT